MDWLVELLGLPKAFHSLSEAQGGGIIMCSTTDSLIATMVAARDRYLRNASSKLAGLGIAIPRTQLGQRLVVLGGK